MLTETRQISKLRIQDVSKEIPSVRKDIAEFSDKSSYFQYATLEMFKAALNNCSMLKLFFLINTLTFTCIVKTSPISIMQIIRTPNHIFYRRIAPKWGQINIFLFSTASFITQLFSTFRTKEVILYSVINTVVRYCSYYPYYFYGSY